MNRRYKIVLTPLNRFYFGGEVSFPIGKNKQMNNSYIVSSAYFPQQTTILGMLRFLILSHNENLFDGSKIIAGQEDEAIKWIGEKSFCIGKESDFGKIKKLSPCYLQISRGDIRFSNSRKFYLAPMDREMSIGFQKVKKDISLYMDENTFQNVRLGDFIYINGKGKDIVPIIKAYDPKKDLPNVYIGEDDEYLARDIFKEDSRIGIRRNNKTGKTEDNALYKQIFYRFVNEIEQDRVEISFAFEVILEEDHLIPEETIVSLGGDSSKFRFKAEFLDEVDESYDFSVKVPPNFWTENVSGCFSKAVLVSDAYMNHPECLFDISETISFRSLKTDVRDTQNYHSFGKSSEFPSKEGKYNLYKKGSVFYFSNQAEEEKFKEELEKYKQFVNIGYNKCVIKKYGSNGN